MLRKLHLIGSVCVVKNKKILFVKRTPFVDSPNVWSLPGGHNEEKENLAVTAVREVKEETNLDIKLSGIVHIVHLLRRKNEYFMIFFSTKIKDASQLKVDNQENDDYCWLNLKDIKNDKIIFRHQLLKDAAIKTLTKKPVRLNLLDEIIENEK